ncbi:MAG: hypothetical protein H0W73_04965 [Bacteroidetes bacterium]|nr:hypothetical protein [Bacteroidota bacterium]
METEHKETNPVQNWESKTETELLQMVYNYASNGLRVGKSKQAREWLNMKKLSIETTMACFNSGQLHHRKEKEFKEALERIGFMKVSNHASNCDSLPYTVFGNFSIMFPLRNKENEIINFYAMGIKNSKTAYLNHEGMYPAYPHEQTKRLFITDTVLDAATILESKVLDNKEAVIALHEGILLRHHKEVIQQLKHLTEIIQITKNK